VHAFSEPDLPARLAEELTSERVPVLHFEAAPSAGVAERLARVGELVRALDSRKLVVLRRSGGIGGELCQPGRLGLELGPGHVLQLRTGGISTVNLRTDYEALMLPRRLRKEDADLLCLIANFFDAQPPARLLVSVASPLRLLEELFTVKGAGTLIKPGSTIDRHASYATLDVAALRALLEASFQRKLVANFFDAEPSAVYVERGYRGAAIVQAGGTAAFLSKFAVEPEAQGEGIGQDLWQSLSLDFPALFWRARPGNPIAAWYAGLADGLMRLPAWHVFWRGVPAAAVPALIEEAMARSVDFEA
jgi:acetylglutamate kinase